MATTFASTKNGPHVASSNSAVIHDCHCTWFLIPVTYPLVRQSTVVGRSVTEEGGTNSFPGFLLGFIR